MIFTKLHYARTKFLKRGLKRKRIWTLPPKPPNKEYPHPKTDYPIATPASSPAHCITQRHRFDISHGLHASASPRGVPPYICRPAGSGAVTIAPLLLDDTPSVSLLVRPTAARAEEGGQTHMEDAPGAPLRMLTWTRDAHPPPAGALQRECARVRRVLEAVHVVPPLGSSAALRGWRWRIRCDRYTSGWWRVGFMIKPMQS